METIAPLSILSIVLILSKMPGIRDGMNGIFRMGMPGIP